MKQRIFVRVDFQNDFVHPNGALSIKNPELIEKMQHFCSSLQQGMFDYIIDTADNHFAETYSQTPESDTYPIHCIHGTWGWQPAAELKDNIPVVRLYKSTTNLWNELPNYKLLQQDWSNTEAYIGGVLTDVCVRQAMSGFLKRGAKVILLEDLCQGADKQVPELMAMPQYGMYAADGRLCMMSSAQFFRGRLHERKCELNLVKTCRGM